MADDDVADRRALEDEWIARARVVFAAIIAIGVFGTASALWTLGTRGVLLARHRVIGCRLAVAFAAMIVLGALGLDL